MFPLCASSLEMKLKNTFLLLLNSSSFRLLRVAEPPSTQTPSHAPWTCLLLLLSPFMRSNIFVLCCHIPLNASVYLAIVRLSTSPFQYASQFSSISKSSSDNCSSLLVSRWIRFLLSCMFGLFFSYHPGQNKYRYRSEIRSKTIGLYQITDVTDLYKIENNKSAKKLQTLQTLQTLQF